jgi:hypothetical protein
MARGGCDFETKAKHAVESGAAVMIVINDDSKPNHAFSMGRKRENNSNKKNKNKNKNQHQFNPLIPCLMISLNSWQAISEDQPDNLRLYPGNDSPFIESVQDYMPSVSIIHNFLSEKEANYLMETSASKLKTEKEERELTGINNKSSSSSSLLSSSSHLVDSVLVHRTILSSDELTAIYDKVATVLDFPSAHFSEFEV